MKLKFFILAFVFVSSTAYGTENIQEQDLQIRQICQFSERFRSVPFEMTKLPLDITGIVFDFLAPNDLFSLIITGDKGIHFHLSQKVDSLDINLKYSESLLSNHMKTVDFPFSSVRHFLYKKFWLCHFIDAYITKITNGISGTYTLKNYSNCLNSLKIEGFSFDGQVFSTKSILDQIPLLKKLETFNISCLKTINNLFPYLTYLNLSHNDFSDNFPNSVSLLTHLKSLDISFCNIKRLPTCFSQLTGLRHLNFGHNSSIGGNFPHIILLLTNLEYPNNG